MWELLQHLFGVEHRSYPELWGVIGSGLWLICHGYLLFSPLFNVFLNKCSFFYLLCALETIFRDIKWLTLKFFCEACLLMNILGNFWKVAVKVC